MARVEKVQPQPSSFDKIRAAIDRLRAKHGPGLSLDAQRKAVVDYLDGGKWTLLDEFTEIESEAQRPARVAKALAACRRHRAKLVIAKLDRLSRNLTFIAMLMDRKVDFVCCDNPTATKFTIHILAAVAEHERDAISARTKAALAAAKKRGVTLGGFRGKVPSVKARMRSSFVVQRGLRTPTGPFFARFFIGIILGLVAGFAFMVPSTRMVLSSSAARWKSPKQIGGLKCRPGCSTGRHALGFWQLNRMSAPRHLRRSPRCSIWR